MSNKINDQHHDHHPLIVRVVITCSHLNNTTLLVDRINWQICHSNYGQSNHPRIQNNLIIHLNFRYHHNSHDISTTNFSNSNVM